MVVNKSCVTGELFGQSIKFLYEVAGVMSFTRPVVTLITILFAVGTGVWKESRSSMSGSLDLRCMNKWI